MTTNIKFGECLNFLLSTLDISINRLSKAINVDCSLVNRWIHEKRIPSYDTIYIESISEYLSKKIQNSFQMQDLDELFLRVCKDAAIGIGMKDKIKKVLSETQGYSIECRKKEMKEAKNCSIGMEQISKYNLTPHINLSSEDKIIIGSENVLSASISLLETAADQKCEMSNTIYISFNNEMDYTNYPHTDLIRWRNVLLKAISNGWNVLFLFRIDSNIYRTVGFIHFAQPLISTGKFCPYYFKKYDTFSSGNEAIIVPGIGALFCLPTHLQLTIDSAFYFKNKVAVDIFKNYFEVLYSSYCQPLVKYTLNHMEFYHCVIESEDRIGNRFIYKYDFSILTLPENLYKKLLKRKKLSRNEVQKSLELYKKRLDAFLLNIHQNEYFDICLTDSINNLVKHKQFYFYCHTGFEKMDLEIQDIIEHLQNIINLLETYDNYHIAFMSQNHNNAASYINFLCCVVKERQAVMIAALKPAKYLPEVRLTIEEPMLVRAFEVYYKEIWEHIAPVNKDKKEVINWLQSQINFLKREASFA